MRTVASLLLLAALISQAGCMFIFGAQVTVRNRSSSAVQEVRIILNSKQVDLGQLSPGQSRSVFIEGSGRSNSIMLSANRGGTKVQRELGYWTDYMRATCEVVFVDGDIKDSCRY
jgi:hypothetical protein